MKSQTLGNKPQTMRKLVYNEDTVTIRKGAPVFLKADSGTRKGFGVKSSNSLAVAEQGFFFGLATTDIPASAYGETVFGYYDSARVIFTSRAASTDVWLSNVAGALGDVLTPITAVGVQALSRSAAGSALTNIKPIILAETFASATTLASSITAGADSSLLYSTAARKVFVVIM